MWAWSQFGCDSSKIIKFDVFGHFWWLNAKSAVLFIAILVVLMETNRLVPWLRQSDHPIQKYHAPRARGTDIYIGFSNFLLHLYWKVLVPINNQSTPVNLFSKHKFINFTQTGLSKSCAARARGTGLRSQPSIETMIKWHQYTFSRVNHTCLSL